MFILSTIAVVALSGGAPVIDATARGVDRAILISALAAPKRTHGPPGRRRYCFDDRITDPTTARRVCRTLAEWRRLGLEPVVG